MIEEHPYVDGTDWLNAIDAHPELFDSDLIVAAAVIHGDGTIGSEGIDEMSVDQVQGSVDDLILFGFLEEVFSIEHEPGLVERSLELRMPPPWGSPVAL
jgi:hypothetical protein